MPCNIYPYLSGVYRQCKTFIFVTSDRECHFSLEVSFYVCIPILRLGHLFLVLELFLLTHVVSS